MGGQGSPAVRNIRSYRERESERALRQSASDIIWKDSVGASAGRFPGDSAIGALRQFLTFLAKMGLSVKDDPRKVVDVAGRTWGKPVNGLAFSVIARTKEDADELAAVSVAIQNRGHETRRLGTGGWLHFFGISVTNSAGASADLTSYGAQLMKADHNPVASEILLPPGEATEIDIPIGSIYRMTKGKYSVQVSCETPGGGRATSNIIEIDA